MSCGHRSRGATISPESPPDKSYFAIDAVKGLLQAVQQGVSSSPKQEDKDPILWVKFEAFHTSDKHSDHSSPFLLFVGYLNSLQIWTIDTVHSGLASEVLSLQEHEVKLASLVRNPRQDDIDKYGDRRPLIAICRCISPKRRRSLTVSGVVSFYSLRRDNKVEDLEFHDEVLSLSSNPRVLVVTLPKEIHVFESGSLQRRVLVSKCYPSPISGVQPVALGSRWLAYADRKLTFHYQSHGGVASDVAVSYAASVFSAASQGISYITEQMGRLTGGFSPPREAMDKTAVPQKHSDSIVPGIVSVVDIQRVGEKFSVEKHNDGEAIVSHFEAHRGQPIQAMSFDPSGQLIITACKLGHDFYVFRLLPHPTCPALGSVHHLYILHRGETTAIVQNIAFTFDSRWVAVSSLRGTTHVFPITSYGGPISKRTHTGVRVVNRLSRYHTSAGLTEKTSTHEPSVSLSQLSQSSAAAANSNIFLNQNPLPKPVTVTALAKIYCHPTTSTSTVSGGSQDSSTSSTLATIASSTAGLIYSRESMRVAATFACSVKRHRRSTTEAASPRKQVQSPVDSLFCIGPDGILMEYHLEPMVEKNSPDVPSSPIELDCQLVQQWQLQRPKNSLPLPILLPPDSPLLLACQSADLTAPAVQVAEPKDDSQNTKWLANIEIYTHEPPARRLWMGPQFNFKTYRTSYCEGGLSAEEEVADLCGTGGAMIQTAGEDDMDPSSLELESLNMQQPSASIPTPQRGTHLQHRESDIVLDAGPCSLDQTQLEICGSSPNDKEKYSQKELSLKMQRNLADAMEDINFGSDLDNFDVSTGLPSASSLTVTPAPGPSFHSSSAPHHAMPSPPRSSRRTDTDSMLK